jgi:3-oxoacyl-[acyl-carrier protein] reductase
MFHVLKAAAPHMIAARYGRIVSFSSMAARSAVNPNPPHYTAAKAGVLGLTRQVAGELGQFGITVNAIAPANVRTLRANATRSDDYVEHIKKVTPLRRLCEPEEVAAAVLFLCSKEAGYITGVTLDVNGGATMI